MGILCLVLVFLFTSFCLSTFVPRLDREQRAGCFTLIGLLMSCDCFAASRPINDIVQHCIDMMSDLFKSII